MNEVDPLLRLLARFREEGVEYVLVGGQAVRLNGFLQATEDVDVLVRPSILSSRIGTPSIISSRTNGYTDSNVSPFAENRRSTIRSRAEARKSSACSTRLPLSRVGLLRTKTRTREKDLLDRPMLERIQQGLGAED